MAEYCISPSRGKLSLCATVFLLAFLKTNSAHNTGNGSSNGLVSITVKGRTEEDVNIVKRELNWNANGFIVSSKDSTFNLKIDYLQPHSASVAVLDNKNYMAFTLYMRNGKALVPNTGIFHFIDSETARQYVSKCERKTMHRGAFYNFYKRCPEEEINVVASGYCYQGGNGRGLVYNSRTFNSIMIYSDQQYYKDNSREVNSYEQSIIKFCFNSWKESKFSVSNWRCSLRDIPIASALMKESEDSRFKRSSEECNDCECISVSGSTFNQCTPITFALIEGILVLFYLFS